jgi:hypothetical protein
MKIKLLNLLLLPWMVLTPVAVRSATPERQHEARRFFAEYEKHVKSSGKRIEAADKLNAALALQPMNQVYRYAELELYQSTCYSHDWNKWIKNIRKQLERCKKFHADFPDYQSKDWNRKLVFNCHKLFGTGRSPFNEIYSRRRQSPTATQKQQLVELCDELRPLARLDLKRAFYSCDLSNGLNSVKELWNYCEIIWRTNECRYYGDYAQFLCERAQAYEKPIALIRKFVKEHPGKANKANKWLTGFTSLYDVQSSNASIKNNSDDIIKHLQNSRNLIEQLQTIPLLTARETALRLDLKRKLVSSPRNWKAMLPVFDKYYAELYKLKPEIFKNRHSPEYYDGFFPWWTRSSKLTDERYQLFRKQKGLFSVNDEIRDLCLARKKDWPKLLSYTNEMRKQNIERIKKLKITNLYIKPAKYFMSKSIPESSPAWRFFYKMNSNFDIKPQSYEKLFDHHKPLKLRAMLKKDNNIYLVLHEGRKKFMLGIWNRKTGRRKLYPVPSNLTEDFLLFGISEGHMPIRPFTPWDADEKRIALASARGNVIIFSLAEGKWTKLEDVVPASARGLVIAGNRIYVLSSQKGHIGYENYLLSFGFNGKDYKINFSSARSSKKHQVEKFNAQPNSLFALSDAKLVFVISWRKAILFSYEIDKDRFEEVCSLPQSAFRDRIYPQGKFLYVQTYGHGSRVYRVDPAAPNSECVLIQDRSKHKLNLKDNFVRTNTSWSLQGPFVFSDRFIWSAWYKPAVINRKAPKRSPQLFLPPCPFLTSDLGRGSVIYFSFYRCFSITPKNKDAKP